MLKNKNVTPFSGINLLINKINQLRQVKEITNIVVSSDSELMIEMANSQGVTAHRRAVEFCDERSKTFGEGVCHICENVSGDDVLWAACTASLAFPKHYSEAIKPCYRALDDGYDSFVSMEAFKRYLWDDKGPVNYELNIKHDLLQQFSVLYFTTHGRYKQDEKIVYFWKGDAA